jgi:plastocyanin
MPHNTSLIACLTLAALASACSIAQSAPQAPPAAGSVTKVTIKNFAFDPAEITVAPGTEVEWTDETGRHTVEADDGSFKSGTLTAGGTFKHRFDRPGVYRYFCEFHGSKGGHDMAGTVKVQK